MKLLVVADIHGVYQPLVDVVTAEPDADAIIFLGDGLNEMRFLEESCLCPHVYSVRGNCDCSFYEPSEAFTAFGGVTFFYTHGNGYDVKTTTAGLKAAAQARGAEVILYAHTHIAYYAFEDGIHLFNPGSISRPRAGRASYGIIEINGGTPKFFHREVPI